MAVIILPRKHYKQPGGKLVLSHEWARDALGVFSHANEVLKWDNGIERTRYVQGTGLSFTTFTTGQTFQVSDARLVAGRDNSTCIAFVSREGLTLNSNGRPCYCERSEDNDIFKFGADSGSTIRANFVFRNAAGSLSNNAAGSSVDLDVANTYHTLAFVVDGASSRTIFADGNHTNDTTTRSNVVNNCDHVSIGSDLLDGPASWNGGIFFVAVFGRSMSLDELTEINRNPWQLFRAEPTRLYFDLGGGTLSIAGLSIALSLDSPALTQAGTLSVNDADIATTLDAVTLSAALNLTVADLLASVALDSPVLTQAHTLAVDDTDFAVTLDAPALTQANSLSVNDSDVAVSLDTPALTQAHALAVDDTDIGITLDSPTLTAAGSLSIADLLMAVAIEQPLLMQAHQLSVADLAMGVTLDGVTITTGLTLTLDGVTIALALDNVQLTQAGVLVIQGLDIPLSVDAVTLTQAHALTVADLLSAVGLDSPELTTAGNVLSIQDAQIAVTLDSPALTQSHILAVNDAVVAVTLGGITIVIPGAEVERYPRITLSRINRVTLDRINHITLSR